MFKIKDESILVALGFIWGLGIGSLVGAFIVKKSTYNSIKLSTASAYKNGHITGAARASCNDFAEFQDDGTFKLNAVYQIIFQQDSIEYINQVDSILNL